MYTAEDSEPFPAGLKVLIVDDDRSSLLVLERLLLACHYQVTKCQRASDALSLLRENEGSFDIVMSDLRMPGINGLKLLEIIGLEMDLPVVMMSSEVRKDVVMKIIIKGACDYLIKPIRMEEIRVIWQHVVRKRNNNSKSYVLSKFLGCSRGDQQQDHRSNFETNNHEDGAFMGSKENNQSSICWSAEKDHQDHDKNILIASQKKPRMVWTTELHDQFVAVVNHLGLENAVPKKILALMNVPSLTRENVASHLQKYRLQLLRKTENGQMKQLEFQSSVVSESDAERLGINVVVGAPLDQQISHYNERLPSQQIFETGQQPSWYQGTEGINHLPGHLHETSTMIAESEQERFPLVERLMQSSVGMERSNDHQLARNGVLNPENYYAAGACVTMSSLDQYEVTENGSNLVVNSRDCAYGYEPIFLVEQHNQESLQLPISSNPQQLVRAHLEVNSSFEPYASPDGFAA